VVWGLGMGELVLRGDLIVVGVLLRERAGCGIRSEIWVGGLRFLPPVRNFSKISVQKLISF
jgi:hypothetical protein